MSLIPTDGFNDVGKMAVVILSVGRGPGSDVEDVEDVEAVEVVALDAGLELELQAAARTTSPTARALNRTVIPFHEVLKRGAGTGGRACPPEKGLYRCGTAPESHRTSLAVLRLRDRRRGEL
jgi:hypothetical protein